MATKGLQPYIHLNQTIWDKARERKKLLKASGVKLEAPATYRNYYGRIQDSEGGFMLIFIAIKLKHIHIYGKKLKLFGSPDS